MGNPIKSLIKKFQGKPERSEIAISDQDSLYGQPGMGKYNPDLLISTKGFEIIDKMEDTDSEIRSSLRTLNDWTLKSGYDIISASDDKADVERADFVQSNFTNIKGSIIEDFRNILGAVPRGYSISEMIYDWIKKGQFKGKLGLVSIKDKNPNEYQPRTDDFGNITHIENVGNIDHGKTYDANKFIVYSYLKKFESVYGRAILRAAYRHYWSIDNIIKFQNIYLNKFGAPTPYAKYPRNASPEEIAAVADVLKTIQTETSFVIPEEFTLEMLEATRKGVAGYQAAIDGHTASIAKLILGQTLTSSQGDVGSQALGRVHEDVLDVRAGMLQLDLEEVVNEQAIVRLIDLNWSNVEKYPKLKMRPSKGEDEHNQVTLFIEAKKEGVIKQVTIEDENKIRSILDFGEREETEREIAEREERDKKPEEKLPEEMPPGETPPEEDVQGGSVPFAEQLSRAKNELEKRVDFVEIVNNIEGNQQEAVKSLTEIIIRSMKALFSTIQSKKLLDKEGNIRDIDRIDAQIKYLNEMRRVIRDTLVTTYKRATTQAKKEVSAGKKKFAEIQWTPLTDIEMLKMFEDKSFLITGTIRNDIANKVKNSIYNGKMTGKTLKQVMFDVEKKLAPYLATGKLKPDKDGVLRVHTPARLETIIRTNTSDALNKARDQAFLDPALDGFVEAFMYSAILDARTRQTHAAMDGKKFPAHDPIWETWTPINGYNCRCVKVAIFQGEQYEVKDPPNVKPDEGFYVAS